MNEINSILKTINNLISNKDPGKNDYISYNIYFKDMTYLSNLLLDVQEKINKRDQKLFKIAQENTSGQLKINLLKILETAE